MRRLAESNYGKIKPRGEPPQRVRPQEPAPVARRLVTLNDEKVEQPSWQRCYLAPSFRTAAARRGRGARSARASSRRRPDQPALSRARRSNRRSRWWRARITWAPRSMRRGSSSTPCPTPGVTHGEARRGDRRRARRASSPTASTRRRSSAPRRGSSPTRSMRRTARPCWRAGTARRWRPASAWRTSANGRRGSRRSTPAAIIAAAKKHLDRAQGRHRPSAARRRTSRRLSDARRRRRGSARPTRSGAERADWKRP